MLGLSIMNGKAPRLEHSCSINVLVTSLRGRVPLMPDEACCPRVSIMPMPMHIYKQGEGSHRRSLGPS